MFPHYIFFSHSTYYFREKSGWFWKQDKAEKFGNYMADVYSVNGMVLESRKRREHLSEEDLQKNKAFIDSFSKGNPGGKTFVSLYCTIITIEEH